MLRWHAFTDPHHSRNSETGLHFWATEIGSDALGEIFHSLSAVSFAMFADGYGRSCR